MECNGPTTVNKKGQNTAEYNYSRLQIVTEELDPWTAWAYRPHTISLLLIGACLLIWASGALNPEKSASIDQVTFVKRGVWAMIAVFLGYCLLQAPSTILIRPHPAIWRLVHGIAVVYLVALTFLLFQEIMAPKSSATEWKYVHHIPESTNKYKCNFCDHEMTGSLTRIRDHLLGLSKDVTACKSIDSATKASLSRAHKSKLENSNKKSKIIKEIGQFSGFTGASTESKSSHSYQTQTTLNEAWKTIAKEEVDTCVARYFYANGVPFHHLRSPYFLSMVDAISNFGKGYKPPSYESVRTKFIEKEMASISAQLQPIRDSWQDTGCTILCDGWSDKRKRTLINVLTQSPQGVMFMKSVDASDDKKSSEYIADIISETISEVGIENVVHVVTDSASNCKGAGKILMERFPTVFWSPCVAHVLDLLLEDISELPWVKKVVNDAKLIAKFITNHQLTLSRFRAVASRELLTPADTRFATNFITLQRIVEERDALRGVVVGKDWSSSSLSKTDTAVHIENILLGSYFWEESRKVMNIFEPIVILLRMADSEALVMGQIYEGMDQAKVKIKEAFDGIESDYIPIWEMVDSRWNMMHTPLHAAACYLDPRSFGTSQMQDTEVMEGLFDCMERMYSDFTIQGKIRKQIDEYISEQGLSGRRAAKEDRKKMSPLSWWKIYGCSLPDLQKFAIRILGQPCSASACERNWSTFDFIHSKKMNRLTSKQLESLVFVHSNLRLLNRNLLTDISKFEAEGCDSDDYDNAEEDEDNQNVDDEDNIFV